MASAAGQSSQYPASLHETVGKNNHRLLEQGEKLSLRLWEAKPGDITDDAACKRTYTAEHDAVLYCVNGDASLHIEGSILSLHKGDSWTIPAKARHTYKVTSKEPFVAVEACHPAVL